MNGTELLVRVLQIRQMSWHQLLKCKRFLFPVSRANWRLVFEMEARFWRLRNNIREAAVCHTLFESHHKLSQAGCGAFRPLPAADCNNSVVKTIMLECGL